jgi:hypothetical protein
MYQIEKSPSNGLTAETRPQTRQAYSINWSLFLLSKERLKPINTEPDIDSRKTSALKNLQYLNLWPHSNVGPAAGTLNSWQCCQTQTRLLKQNSMHESSRIEWSGVELGRVESSVADCLCIILVNQTEFAGRVESSSVKWNRRLSVWSLLGLIAVSII